MKVINARNVNEAFILGLKFLDQEGVLRDSRNGPVYTFPGPVTTRYRKPRERVITFKERDANPYFHFMESLWMLAGRRDVEWISQFSSNIANYSDDGVTFHGAYGWRWRNHFRAAEGDLQYGTAVVDQLETIANLLRQNPDDRRVVLQMWDAEVDLGMKGKDFPCNLMVNFRINPYGKLDMTVFNRSNDMIWGAYGANAVHFSVLQEVIAHWVGAEVGEYWQVSTNLHAYKTILEKHRNFKNLLSGWEPEPYELGTITPYQIVNTSISDWFSDLKMFIEEGPVIGFKDPFFKKVAVPMLQSWLAWKDPDNRDKALNFARQIAAEDWRMACVEWLERRL